MTVLSNGLGRGPLLAYASPTFCLMFLVGPAQSVIQGIYTQHFGVKLVELASIILICRVFDAFTDPAIGFLSDRTRGRLPGGRKALVVLGSILSIVAVHFLFIPQGAVSANYFFLWFMLCYLGWTIIEIPHLSWGSELSHDYKDHSTIFTYRAFFYYLGYVAFLALPFLPIFEQEGYTPDTLVAAFWIVAVLFPITVFGAAKFCPQGENLADRGGAGVLHAFRAIVWNKPLRIFTLTFVAIGLGIGMQTGVAFLYITSFLGLAKEAPIIFVVSFPFAILGLPIWLRISEGIGKHYGMTAGTLLTSGAFLCLAMMRPGEDIFWWFFALNAFIHLVQSSWISIGPSMLGDIIDYDRSITGKDNSATYYAFFTFIRKTFEGVGGGIGLYIAAYYGFEPSALVISEDVIFGMQLVMGYLPALIFLVAAAASFKSPITAARHREILAAMERRSKVETSPPPRGADTATSPAG